MQAQPGRLGVHISIAGGVHLSMERARDLGCTTAQIFSHNPRTWAVKPLIREQVALFRELRQDHGITPVFIHASYLINLAAKDRIVLERSIALLIREMDLADELGAEYVVIHTGSASGDPGEIARQRASDALLSIAAAGQWKAKLLLENTAGERGDISSTVADIADILHSAAGPLLGGIALDTCHAFQAGYELTSVQGMERLVHEVERHVGLDQVRLIHLNDSRRGFHCRVDRHEHIGAGAIGTVGIRLFLGHQAFREVPLILETPKDSEEDDRRNLASVRRILRQERAKDRKGYDIYHRRLQGKRGTVVNR